MNDGKLDMRICTGITMAGEMFPAGQHSMILESCDGGGAHPTDLFRFGSKCAIPNDGVSRIGMDIQNRGHIHVNAHTS